MDQQPQNQPEQSPPETEAPVPPMPPATDQAPQAEQPPTSPVPPVPPAPPEPGTQLDSERPNQLAALMLTSSFGFYGIHQLYLGNKTQGYVRLALGILVWPLTFVIVGLLIIPVLGLWALYDFVQIGFGKTKDISGRPLVATERDAKWARVLTVVALVVLAIYTVSAVLFILAMISFMNDLDSGSATPIYDFPSF